MHFKLKWIIRDFFTFLTKINHFCEISLLNRKYKIIFEKISKKRKPKSFRLVAKYYNDMISCEVKNLNLILMEPVVWILLILRLRFKKHSSRDGHWANDHMTNCKLSLLYNGNGFWRVKRKVAYEVKHF